MKDSHGREVDHLRVSVTRRCNLSCPYCHHEGDNEGCGGEATAERLVGMVREAAGFGIRKVKITGGEPLLRTDLADIIRGIKSIDGIEEVSLTTNGFRLAEMAGRLKSAGLDRVNIGCDAVGPSMAKNAAAIREGVEAAKEAGLSPIKLNMVVLRGINDTEIEGMIRLAGELGVRLQLIELVDNGDGFFERHHLPLAALEEEFRRRAQRVIHRDLNNRTVYVIGGVEVEVVAPSSRDFCRGCRKMRITASGEWKPCLRREERVPYTHGSYEGALARRKASGEEAS